MDGHSQYTPKSGFARWLERRLPIVSFMYDSFVAYPTPKNLNYMWTFGAILSFMLVAQIVTGIVLAMHYTGETTLAFNSVESIMRDVNWGWALRYAHANGASMFFLAVYIHMARGMYYGSYKEPREVLWILGVVIFMVMIATGFLGYVLPWGQMSFWAATVITNLFSAFPVVGGPIREWLIGGYSVDNPTLNRFFALHYLLPFIIVAVVALHVWALHVTGQNNPTGVEVKDVKKETVPFTPFATMKDGFAIGVFLVIYAWMTFFVPNYLGHPDNYIEANPLVTPPHIVPEWYFLPFYAILRAIPNKLLGVIAMFLSILIMAALPWLDKSPVKSGSYRPLFRKFYWVFIAVSIALGYLGAQPAEGVYLWLARIASLYYFLHFVVILPLLTKYEKPEPVPESIDASVAAGSVTHA
ncbi:MAG: cytochrome b [Methylocystis sp.]|nr:MAG: cytochrome b [Methylocystis sp.]